MNLSRLREENRRQTQIICSVCFGCFVFKEVSHEWQSLGNGRDGGCHLFYLFSWPLMLFTRGCLPLGQQYPPSSVWAKTSKKNLEKLQRVQNFAARIITGTKKHEHISPVLRELNWLPVHLTVQYRDTVMAFKCMKGLAPSYLCEKFRKRSEVHSRATRNNNMLNVPFYKSASGQRTFHYRATKLWNAMSDDMKNYDHIGPFKHSLKRSLWEDF